MTRDYAKRPKRTPPARNTRRQPSRKTLPGWLWMAGGILVGVLAMTIINHRPAPAQQEIIDVVQEPEPEAGTGTPRPRFDFYTLLKESEVILNDDGTPPIATLPAPVLPPPSQPRDGDDDSTIPVLPGVEDREVVTSSSPEPPVATAPATPPPRTESPAPAAEPQPTSPSTTQTQPTREVFLLQAGSFKSASDADNLRARLLLLNMRARVETVNLRPGETWHRVQVGPFDNTQSLASARNLLQQNGIASIQVKKTQ